MPYYERVLVGIGKPFSKMIKHGEMAEMGLKAEKIVWSDSENDDH